MSVSQKKLNASGQRWLMVENVCIQNGRKWMQLDESGKDGRKWLKVSTVLWASLMTYQDHCDILTACSLFCKDTKSKGKGRHSTFIYRFQNTCSIFTSRSAICLFHVWDCPWWEALTPFFLPTLTGTLGRNILHLLEPNDTHQSPWWSGKVCNVFRKKVFNNKKI